ncbi:MAG: hypothetical protein ACREX9_03225 [Gammaproteobacteria bacterium]
MRPGPHNEHWVIKVYREVRACEKIVASEGRSRSAGVQDRFAGSETARKPQRGESQGWDEQPECILKYMRIPSTAGTRDPERGRFFHKLSAMKHCSTRKLGLDVGR